MASPINRHIKDNDYQYISEAKMTYEDVMAIKLDEINSVDMLNLLLDKHYVRDIDAFFPTIYVSRHREHMFNRIISRRLISPRALLALILEPFDCEDSCAVALFLKISRDKQQWGNGGEAFSALQMDYAKYLCNIYKALTGHYPTMSDIRDHIVKVDIIMSLIETDS